jgi:TolA-binding protein
MPARTAEEREHRTMKASPTNRRPWLAGAILLALSVCAAMLAPAQEEVEAEPIESPEAFPDDSAALQQELAAVRAELTELRDEVAALREEVGDLLDRFTEDLKRENERLRDELARLRSASPAEPGLPRVPSPGDSWVDRLIEEAVPPAAAEEEPPVPMPEAEADVPDFVPDRYAKAFAEAMKRAPTTQPCVFTSVKDWGRTPAQAAKAVPKARSLKGMVGTVPAGSKPEALIALGQKLREQYAEYDNISIDVFDDAAAARAFAERRAMDDARHVLSVKKDAETGRDVIVLLQDGQAMEVPVAPLPAGE